MTRPWLTAHSGSAFQSHLKYSYYSFTLEWSVAVGVSVDLPGQESAALP